MTFENKKSLAPPRGNFYESQKTGLGVKIILLKKSLKSFDKNSDNKI
jgi:hypothetical protein